MKKTIEVWINKSWEQGRNSFTNFREQGGRCANYTQKATLIIDVPEPKIEITPSRLREVINNNNKRYGGDSGTVERIIKELFPEYEGEK